MSAGGSSSSGVASESSKNKPPKTIVLRSSDFEEFEVDLVVAKQSELIKMMIQGDGCVKRSVPLADVSGRALAKVVEYWKQHSSGKEAGDLKTWDEDFVKVPKEELLDLIAAAKYLDTKPLFRLCCQAVADIIKYKSIPDVLKYFHEPEPLLSNRRG